ncbi:MAG: choice-of-anchor tandem repeat GloVer-containing protein [Candidatus Sulfotelmatobacter sp.]
MRPFRFFVVIPTLLAALINLSAAQTPSGHRFNALTTPVFTTLVNFDQTDGASAADTTLVQGTDGNFYGVAEVGGANSDGTVFNITPTGTLTTIYNFCSLTNCADGSIPSGGLIQGANGNFYGVTVKGGAYNGGTMYEITPDGVLTTLHSFDSVVDGANPIGTLLQSNGYFYGVTQPYSTGTDQQGTVYKISASGTVTTLYYFCSQINCADGTYPVGGLIQASDGNLYGETNEGGNNSTCLQTQSYGCGTIYRITPAGVLTTLHSFAGYPDDGNEPSGGLLQASDGNLYGVTAGGGTNNAGTAFKITFDGTLTTLYSFCAQEMRGECLGGRSPYAGFVQGTDGNLYSAAYAGGTYDYGTVYKMTTQGRLTVEHSFDSTDGGLPGGGGVLQGTDGSFYGATENDGEYGYGTLFNISVGLAPFVKTQTTIGRVGSSVVILGMNLTGASSVTFNGTAAVFTVVSSSEITATVPTGATTGPVVVTTPGGALTSNVNFRIVP